MKDRIRQLMEAQHMTQQTFANFLGISPATLSGIFQGRTKPTLNTVDSIKSKFSNISLDWLMFGKGMMFVDEASADDSSSTPQESGMAGEQMLDFGDADGNAGATSQQSAPMGNAFATNVRQQPKSPVHTDIVYKEKERRRITEIRVFYDDQTWESFVPKK